MCSDFSADQDHTTDSTSSSQGQSKKTNSTPIIVGVVVGVVGGLALLGLALWLFCRRRKRRERHLLPDPYSNGAAREHQTKAEFVQAAPAEEPRIPSSSSGDPQLDHTVGPRRDSARRIVQEEDAEAGVEYLPPRYREIWSRPEPDQPASADSNDSPDISSPATASKDFAAPSTPPVQDVALEDKVRGLNAERPSLKQEYARAFGRVLPQPPQSTSPSGSRQVTQQK